MSKKSKKNKILSGLLWSAVALALVLSFAQYLGVIDVQAGYGKTFNFQGRLTDSDGNYANGNYDMVFYIFENQTGGTGLWKEPHANIPVEDSVFNVSLGTTSSLDSLDFNDGTYWLEIYVEGEKLTPRRRIGGTGYSINSDHLEGLPASAFDIDRVVGYGNETSKDIYLKGQVELEHVPVSLNDTNIDSFPDDERGIFDALNYLLAGGAGSSIWEDLGASIQPKSGVSSTITGATWQGTAVADTYVAALNGASRGDVLYHDGSSWQQLSAGASGDFLKTNGVGADPAWASVSGTIAGGTVNNSMLRWNGANWIENTNITGTAAGNLNVEGLAADGLVSLGDGGDTVAINSSDWDITTGGNMSGIGNITADGNLSFSTAQVLGASPLRFEGATDDDVFSTFAFTDPTGGGNTITFQDASGTVAYTSDIPAGAGLWTDGGAYIYPTNTGTGFKVYDAGNLEIAGTFTLPNTNTITGVANYAQFSQGISVGGATTYYLNSAGSANVAGLAADGLVSLGDGGDTVAINSSDWDITTGGNMTGIGNITADGNLSLSTAQVLGASPLRFEGATDDDVFSTFAFTDPTGGGNTITFQNASGTVAYTSDIPAGAGLWTDSGAYIYPTNTGTNTRVYDNGNLQVLGGTLTMPNSNVLTGVANYAQFDLGVSVGGATTYYINSSGSANLNAGTFGGTFIANGQVGIGDGGDSVAINSGDWDITTTGNMSGIGNITADGNLSFSTAQVLGASPLRFEGATDDDVFSTFAFTDPTGGGNTITFQDASGTVAYTSDIPAGAGLWTDGGAYIYPTNTGTGFKVYDAGNLEIAGTFTLPNTNTITGVANYAQFSQGISVGGATTYYLNSAGSANVAGLAADGLVSLGDGGDTVAINSSDWDITTGGNMSGIGDISADGNLSLSTAQVLGASPLRFEGGTDDDIFSTFAFTDPTGGGNTITYQNASGTVAYTSDIPAGAGLWTDNGAYVYPTNTGTSFRVFDAGGLELTSGSIALPNSNTISGVAGYTQFSLGISVGGGTTYYINNVGSASLNALDADGQVTLGDGGDTAAVDSTNWDIAAGGDITVTGNAFEIDQSTAAGSIGVAHNDSYALNLANPDNGGRGINIAKTGAGTNTYGAYISNTGTATDSNYGLYIPNSSVNKAGLTNSANYIHTDADYSYSGTPATYGWASGLRSELMRDSGTWSGGTYGGVNAISGETFLEGSGMTLKTGIGTSGYVTLGSSVDDEDVEYIFGVHGEAFVEDSAHDVLNYSTGVNGISHGEGDIKIGVHGTAGVTGDTGSNHYGVAGEAYAGTNNTAGYFRTDDDDNLDYAVEIINASSNATADALMIETGPTTSTAANYFITFRESVTHSIIGKIQGNGAAVAYTTTGPDLAEYFPAVEDLAPAEVVTLNGAGKIERAKPGDEPFGIISTNPGFIGNFEGPDRELVALIGQVPTIVNDEGGAITAGDRITLSSIPGVGKKASAGEPVIGMALEPFQKAKGKVNVLVSALSSQLTSSGTSGMQNGLFDGDVAIKGALDVQSPMGISAFSMWSKASKWHITSEGEVYMQDIEMAEGDNKALGNTKLPAGQSEVFVPNSSVNKDSRIFLTVDEFDNIPISVKVKSKHAGQDFVLSTLDGQPASTDVSVNWLIIN
ncbi:beta strand repeat-containing protein [Patescibacteria group bacterium]